MKKIILSLALIVSVIFLTACGDKTPEIVGKWSGETNDGINATFVFHKDNTIDYDNTYFSNSGKYSLDGNKVTIEDVWDNPKTYEYKIKDNKLSLIATDSYSPSYSGLSKIKK